MDALESDQFALGVQQIERGIIAKAKERGLAITAMSFTWNQGRKLLPPPDRIRLDIKLGEGKSARAVFSREQVEESFARINRWDVDGMISVVAEQLGQ